MLLILYYFSMTNLAYPKVSAGLLKPSNIYLQSVALTPEPRYQSPSRVASHMLKVLGNLMLWVQNPILLQAALIYTSTILRDIPISLCTNNGCNV